MNESPYQVGEEEKKRGMKGGRVENQNHKGFIFECFKAFGLAVLESLHSSVGAEAFHASYLCLHAISFVVF